MSIDHSEFLEAFPIPLHHRQPGKLWVFWSQYEGRQNNTSASDHAAYRKIQEKIKLAFSSIVIDWWFLAQFWAPVTIGSKRLLSTSGQPFAVSHLSKEFTLYRLYSEKYHYNIDVNKINDIEPDHMIMSGGPATAFLRRLPYFAHLQWIHWSRMMMRD